MSSQPSTRPPGVLRADCRQGRSSCPFIPTSGCKFFLQVPKTPNPTAPKCQQDVHIHDNKEAAAADRRGQTTCAPPAPSLALGPLEENHVLSLSQIKPLPEFTSKPSPTPASCIHTDTHTHTHPLRHTHIYRDKDTQTHRDRPLTRLTHRHSQSNTDAQRRGQQGREVLAPQKPVVHPESCHTKGPEQAGGIGRPLPCPLPLHADGQPSAPVSLVKL